LFGNLRWNFASYKNPKNTRLNGDDDDRVRIR